MAFHAHRRGFGVNIYLKASLAHGVAVLHAHCFESQVYCPYMHFRAAKSVPHPQNHHS